MKIAFLYFKEYIASTVYDHIHSFERYSSNDFTYIDISNQFLTAEELNQFNVVIIHYTIFLFLDDRCPAWLRLVLRKTSTKKVVFIQDEYRLVNDIIENLNFIKADLLYTCVPNSEIEKVYPKDKLPNLIKINTLTGFISEELLSMPRASYDERKVDVVYRARKLSAWYGRLGQEKWVIAERFVQDAKKYQLATDISYKKDRIYGENWIKFLQGAKAAIGCESGASVFDFTGDIQKNVEQYESENPKASFEEIEEKFFKGLDGKIKLNQISPRCFECAALGTLMILYEGEYSNILKPWRHYIPLKKDHSNMKEVVDFIRCRKKWEAITTYAFEEIAMNKEYSYKHFIQKFENDLKEFFKFNSPTEKRPIIINSLLQQEVFYKKTTLRFKLTDILKYLANKILGIKSKEYIILLKRRIMLSIRTLQSLIKSHNKNHYKYALRKNFCEEYKFVNDVKEYITCIKEKCNYFPIKIENEKSDECIIIISDNFNNVENIDFSFFSEYLGKITVKIEDSWGVPQNIKGKSHTLKYPTLLTNNRIL